MSMKVFYAHSPWLTLSFYSQINMIGFLNHDQYIISLIYFLIIYHFHIVSIVCFLYKKNDERLVVSYRGHLMHEHKIFIYTHCQIFMISMLEEEKTHQELIFWYLDSPFFILENIDVVIVMISLS